MVGEQPGSKSGIFDACFDTEGVPERVKDLTNDFSVVDGRGSYWARQSRLFKLQKVRAEERERIEEKAEAGIAAMMATAVVATELQIKAFERTLDQYETATVEALIANE